MESLSLHEARQLALAAQGFGGRPSAVAETDLRRVVDHVGLVQIDSVNVLERAHYLPFFSRLGPYDREALDVLAYRKRALFEQWGHAASLIDIRHYGLLRFRMERERTWKEMRRIIERDPGYVESVLDEVRRRGPLSVGDLEDGGARRGPWWGYSHGKIALEWHFARGALAVAGRRNFARLYDIPERVFPQAVLEQPAPTAEDAQRELLRLAARALGVATAHDLADYYRIKLPEARPRIRELVDAGDLRVVQVEGWKDTAYMPRQAKAARPDHRRALLGPFDSLIWERSRTERLFRFHYRIEIYVPEKQRRFGYYVLPFLLDDELVARVDLKANRQSSTLEVRRAHIEDEENTQRVAPELAAELRTMADWLRLEWIKVSRRGAFGKALAAAVAVRR